MMEDENETSAFRHRKKSGMSISACFHLGGTHSSDHFLISISSPSSSSPSAPSPNFPKSPTSSWFRSHKHKCHELPDMIKPKRRNLMGRHCRHASADFHYDPLSYALNFVDEEAAAEDDRDQNHNFVARLPVTPPRRRAVDELAVKMDVMELREKCARRRDSSGGESRTNVFEVRTPGGKADIGRSPTNGGRRNIQVSSPRVPQEVVA